VEKKQVSRITILPKDPSQVVHVLLKVFLWAGDVQWKCQPSFSNLKVGIGELSFPFFAGTN